VGRPAMAGGSVFTAVRLPTPLSEAVDAWSIKAKVSRSVALRRLIEAGLKRRPKA
jgi:metal-responsive CopG/Arc/MetJ family transcriptional regulator